MHGLSVCALVHFLQHDVPDNKADRKSHFSCSSQTMFVFPASFIYSFSLLAIERNNIHPACSRRPKLYNFNSSRNNCFKRSKIKNHLPYEKLLVQASDFYMLKAYRILNSEVLSSVVAIGSISVVRIFVEITSNSLALNGSFSIPL